MPTGVIKTAVATVLTGAMWKSCRVRFMRNLLAVVPKGAREAVAAVLRTIFAQPDHASAVPQLRRVIDGLRPRFPEAAARPEEAAEDVLAHLHFSKAHRARLHSTNPLERLNKGDPAAHARRRDLPDAGERCCAWSAPYSPSRTTSGRWPTAATSARSPCGNSCSPITGELQQDLAAVA